MFLKIRKMQPDVIGITKPAIKGDAGYDIYSAETIVIKAHSANSVHTQTTIELPEGYWLEILPKSGLATKHNIAVHNGVIDNGYRGEIIVHIYNHGDDDYTFNKNDKLAQGIIRKLYDFELKEVKELNTSIRGDKGFGSTGK